MIVKPLNIARNEFPKSSSKSEIVEFQSRSLAISHFYGI